MDLTDALGVREREVVAFVGGGGKTTAMYRLCVEAAARGRRALATGTARFTLPEREPDAPLISDADEERLVESIRQRLGGASPWLIACSGQGSKERLLPLSYSSIDALSELAELQLIAIEADGSAMRPFKAPAEHEPVIPLAATVIVAVAGADILGRRLTGDRVHRPEHVAAICGAEIGDEVTAAMVARVLAHPEGGRKGVPASARFAVLLNKVAPARLDQARETAQLLRREGVELVVLARAREEPPVVEVFASGVSRGL